MKRSNGWGCLPLMVAFAVIALAVTGFGWMGQSPDNEQAALDTLRHVYLSGPAGLLFYIFVGWVLIKIGGK